MDGTDKATLIIADDHPLFVKGLLAVLKKEFLILGVASNGNELLNLLKIFQPNGILLDLQMPYMDGLSAARQIGKHYPQIKLIVLSGFYDFETECQLRQAGVQSYLTKDLKIDCLVDQINSVLKGGTSFCSPKEEVRFLINHSANNDSIHKHKLSSRELEVISLARKGLTSGEIAKALFISINTVEAHRKHIFKKLDLRNIQGLVEFACKYAL